MSKTMTLSESDWENIKYVMQLLVLEAYDNAKEHGFHYEVLNIGEKIALIHSEVSEALEAYRDGELNYYVEKDGKPEGFPTELADVIIRVFDLVGRLGKQEEFVRALQEKMHYNRERPYKHGKII